MKLRRLELGSKNLVGARVTEARQMRGMKQVELLARLQTRGIDISIPALSLLEGQKRPVTDIELAALSDVLGVSVDWLLGRTEYIKQGLRLQSLFLRVFKFYSTNIWLYLPTGDMTSLIMHTLPSPFMNRVGSHSSLPITASVSSRVPVTSAKPSPEMSPKSA